MAKPIPDGYNTVSTYIVVQDAEKALDFYAKAFGAEPCVKMPGPGGHGVMHAEMRLGDSMVMLTEVNPQWGLKCPKGYGGSPATLHIYVEDADALFQRAVGAGCEVKFPVTDMFWGDRFGKVVDPFGHEWGIATHKEDLSDEELAKRREEFFASMQQGGQDCPGS